MQNVVGRIVNYEAEVLGSPVFHAANSGAGREAMMGHVLHEVDFDLHLVMAANVHSAPVPNTAVTQRLAMGVRHDLFLNEDDEIQG